MSRAIIQVHAQFPNTPAQLATASWDWVHCLTFPVDTLNRLRLSSRPYKWIRYATGVVVGAQGDLSLHPDHLTLVEYEAETLPSATIDLYYSVPAEEQRRMLPVDPGILNPMVATGTSMTSRRGEFRDDVMQRDDSQCAVTGIFPENSCDAVHLLAHSKGDSYISAFTRGRLKGTEDDIIETIDDVRNGLLMNKISHVGFGRHFAILKTPNFALETGDVVPGGIGQRFTAQLLNPGRPVFLVFGPDAPIDPEVHTPSSGDMSQWPPDILFDAVYASAVGIQFGEHKKLESALLPWRDVLYPSDAPMTTSQRDQKLRNDKEAGIRRKQGRTRKNNRDRDSFRLDGLDFITLLPYINMDPEKVERYWREQREEAASKEREELEAKIYAWRRA